MKSVCFVFPVLLCSCALFQPARVIDLHVSGQGAEGLGQAELVLDTIEVEKEMDADTVRENAIYILSLLSARHVPDGGALQSFRAQIKIKEKTIFRDYQTLNTVSLEISLFKDDDPAILFLLCEETLNTVSSYKYLYEILELAFKRIYR